jgi:hypothetical protein
LGYFTEEDRLLFYQVTLSLPPQELIVGQHLQVSLVYLWYVSALVVVVVPQGARVITQVVVGDWDGKIIYP